MLLRALQSALVQARGALVPCRGCLGPLDGHAEAGLCGRCWAGLTPLPGERCGRCALVHAEDACPEPVAWERGDALWDYHGGRPPLGALLLPAIKQGEAGWARTLLRRLALANLPAWARQVDGVTSAPSSPWRRLQRGMDFSEAAARLLAHRLDRPYRPLLAKGWWAGRQASRSESQRRRLPRKAIRLGRGCAPAGTLLLVDDVWTTGTTLLRCAQALTGGGAGEIRVLTLFRAF